MTINTANSSPRKAHVVIIGGGASGCITALGLLKADTHQNLKISILEPRRQLCLGRAYSTTDDNHLLNVPANRMSAYPDAPLDFENWLRKQAPIETFPYWPFVPRRIYGQYLQEQIEQSQNDCKITHKQTKAIQIQSHGVKYLIKGEDKSTLTCDAVVIATGYSDKTQWDNQLCLDASDITPSSSHSLGKNILVIGAGLSAIDLWRTLRTRADTKITFISRHGLTPLSQLQKQDTPFLKIPDGLSPRQLLAFLRPISKAYSWQDIADTVRPLTQRTWSTWSHKERRQFLRHLKHYWEIIRHRTPYKINEELLGDIKQSRLRVDAGRIRRIKKEPDQFVVDIQYRFSNNISTVTYDAVINATGSKIDQSFSEDLKSLGIIKCPHGLGYINDGAPRIWAVGPSAKSQYWEITAIPEIRVQISSVIKEIYHSLNSTPRSLRIGLFTQHPYNAGESYFEHFQVAFGFFRILIQKALMVICHAFAPWVYPDNVSNDLRELSSKMSRRRRRYYLDSNPCHNNSADTQPKSKTVITSTTNDPTSTQAIWERKETSSNTSQTDFTQD